MAQVRRWCVVVVNLVVRDRPGWTGRRGPDGGHLRSGLELGRVEGVNVGVLGGKSANKELPVARSPCRTGALGAVREALLFVCNCYAESICVA